MNRLSSIRTTCTRTQVRSGSTSRVSNTTTSEPRREPGCTETWQLQGHGAKRAPARPRVSGKVHRVGDCDETLLRALER
jgi:hypothetical protein